MATREEVYKAIDSERNYQNSLGPDKREPREEHHSVGDFITMLSSYVSKLQSAWTDNPGDTEALKVMRKCAGITVRCMEEHGAPPR